MYRAVTSSFEQKATVCFPFTTTVFVKSDWLDVVDIKVFRLLEPNRRVDASHRYAGSGTGKREAAAGEPLPCHLPFPFLSPSRLFLWGGLVSSSPSPVTCAALAPSRVLPQSLSLST